MKRKGMLVSERVVRTGKKKNEEMRRASNSLLSQMSRLPLYSNALFIWLLVFFEQRSHLPFNPLHSFLSGTSSLRHCIFAGKVFCLKFWFEYIPRGKKKKCLKRMSQGLILNPAKTSKSSVEELKKERVGRWHRIKDLGRELRNTDLHQCPDNPRESLYGR